MESSNNSKSNTQQKNKKIAKSLFATAISNVKAQLPNSEVLHNAVSKKRSLEDMNITTSGNILNVNNAGKRSHIENVGIESQSSSSTSKVAISCDPVSKTNSKVFKPSKLTVYVPPHLRDKDNPKEIPVKSVVDQNNDVKLNLNSDSLCKTIIPPNDSNSNNHPPKTDFISIEKFKAVAKKCIIVSGFLPDLPETTKQSLLQPLTDYNGKVYWISSVDAIVVFSTEKKAMDSLEVSLHSLLRKMSLKSFEDNNRKFISNGVIPSLDENKGHLAPSIANRIIGNALGIRVAKVTT